MRNVVASARSVATGCISSALQFDPPECTGAVFGFRREVEGLIQQHEHGGVGCLVAI